MRIIKKQGKDILNKELKKSYNFFICKGKNIYRCYSWYDIYAKIKNM